MCGIFGYIAKKPPTLQTISDCQNIQFHRGPDRQGEFKSRLESWHIGLFHQRLSILDLSEAGNQPAVNNSHDKAMVFNGEIYNFKEIEKKQSVYKNTKSDTVVLFNLINDIGPEKAFDMADGMWAIGYLDIIKKELILSRDRFGEKPLYYTQNADGFFFASELKTLIRLTGRKFSLNPRQISDYLSVSLFGHDSDTYYQDIYQVLPSSQVKIDLSKSALEISQKKYWILKTIKNDFSLLENAELLRSEFRKAVTRQLRSDVPVGLLLSGGIDSSAIAAMAEQVSSSQVSLLSAVSDDFRYDESKYIDIMAKALDRNVNKVNSAPQLVSFFEDLHRATYFADVPVGSMSNILHFKLMERASDLGITVILSGQGADELLCGYKKFLGFYIKDLLSKHSHYSAIKTLLQFYRNGTVIDQFSLAESKRYLPSFLSRHIKHDIRGDAIKDSDTLKLGIGQSLTTLDRQINDLFKFSVPQLNHFEDRMSMANSKEIRLPFLSRGFVEAAMQVPVSQKLRSGWTKYAFRVSMDDFLPSEIAWRKDKQGFVNPQSSWLKHDLKDMLLNEYFEQNALIFKLDLVNFKSLHKKYKKYLSQPDGRGTIWFREIFAPLALEVWLRENQEHILGL